MHGLYITEVVLAIQISEDCALLVGRSSVATEGWMANVLEGPDSINLNRFRISHSNGAARAAHFLSRRTALVGGDSNELIRIQVGFARVTGTGRTVGPYEGTKFTILSSQLSQKSIRVLTLLGAVPE